MALTFSRMPDYNYSSAHRVYEVKQGNTAIGVLENWEGKTEWKAFSGSGFSCKFLSKHYSREAAVDAIVAAAANL